MQTFIFVLHPLVVLTRLGIPTHISLERGSTWYLCITELKPWYSFTPRTRTPERMSHDNASHGVTFGQPLNLPKSRCLFSPILRSWSYIQVPRDAGKQQWSMKVGSLWNGRHFLSKTSHFDTLCFLGLSLYCQFVYSYVLMSAVWITVCNRSPCNHSCTHTMTWLPLARSETWLHTHNTSGLLLFIYLHILVATLFFPSTSASMPPWCASKVSKAKVNNVPLDPQEGSPAPAAPVPSCPLPGQVQCTLSHSHVPVSLIPFNAGGYSQQPQLSLPLQRPKLSLQAHKTLHLLLPWCPLIRWLAGVGMLQLMWRWVWCNSNIKDFCLDFHKPTAIRPITHNSDSEEFELPDIDSDSPQDEPATNHSKGFLTPQSNTLATLDSNTCPPVSNMEVFFWWVL